MKNVKILAVVTMILIFLTACGSKNSATSKRTYTMKIGHGTAESSLYHFGAVKFKELVEQKSNGKIKVEIYPNGQIGHDKELLEKMKLGAIEGGVIGTEPIAGWAPKIQVINLPYLFKDRETAYRILDGNIGEEIFKDQPKQNGIRLLAYFENGFRQVTNNTRPINGVADLKGIKIRVSNSPVSIAIFKALGANPTPMSFGEVYTALEQKVVDGQENPLALIESSKFYEVQKYLAITNHIYSPCVLLVSEKFYQSLPDDLKKAVVEAAKEARDLQRKESQKRDQELLEILKQKGMQVTTPNIEEFAQATKDVHLEFDDKYGKEFYEKVINEINSAK
ncbi:TRAP transporter substrate-binding protein [Thermoanaerobacterium sp. DL9XJH110]|uniref:TRAP transporter substrate-binding protein n=1 Tax=Thermoanaerobacterium sp. DL9XJH110 TaxID=3386643 RepID=UPI003BB71015